MDIRENFYETIRGGKPEFLVNEWEPFGFVFDPLMALTLVGVYGKTVIDDWGVTIYWGEDEPGIMPIVNDETKVIKDICKWREYVKTPDIKSVLQADWSGALSQQDEIRQSGKLSVSLMSTGHFEQCHYLMGFEDTLMNLLIEPDSMHELLDYIHEYKMTYAKILIEKLKPDVVLTHDDWGSKTNLFMSDDNWREFFKPRYKEFFKLFNDSGIIVLHHSDSVLELIVEDMEEIGIDIWQGALPQNDIPAIQKRLKKMAIMGGIDAAIVDHKEYDEEVIRAEVRRCCDAYVPGGKFIPCLTYGGEGSIFTGVNDVIMDEIRKISPKYF